MNNNTQETTDPLTQQNILCERSAIVTEMIKKRRAERNSKLTELAVPKAQTVGDIIPTIDPQPIADPPIQQSWNATKGLNVFERLILDAKKKQKKKKAESMIMNASEIKRSSSITPHVENRLLAHQKEHQNWVAKERFKKQSKELSESRNNSRISPKPERPLSIYPKKPNTASAKRFPSHEFNNTPLSENLLEQANKLASILNSKEKTLVRHNSKKVEHSTSLLLDNKTQAMLNVCSNNQVKTSLFHEKQLPRNEYSNSYGKRSAAYNERVLKEQKVSKEEAKLTQDMAKAQSVMQMLEARKKDLNKTKNKGSSVYKENINSLINNKSSGQLNLSKENIVIKRKNFQNNFEEPIEDEPFNKPIISNRKLNWGTYHNKAEDCFNKTQSVMEDSNRKRLINSPKPQIYYESIEERIKRMNYATTPKPQHTPSKHPKTTNKPLRKGNIQNRLNVAERNDLWLRRRNEKIAKQKNAKAAMETSGCTFSPLLETRSYRNGLNDCRSMYEQMAPTMYSPEELIEIRYSNSYSAIKRIQARSRSRDVSCN